MNDELQIFILFSPKMDIKDFTTCCVFRGSLYITTGYTYPPSPSHPSVTICCVRSEYLDVKMPGLVPYVMIMLLVYITVKTTIHSGSRKSIYCSIFVSFLMCLCRKGQYSLYLLIWFSVPNWKWSGLMI